MAFVSLRAAILGFLDLEPTSGYTLKQRFEGSVGSFWTVTQSQIYRELHALEREGLVEVRREPGEGKPDRKVYSLTEAGRGSLAAWLHEPLEPLQLRHPLLLKLVFAAELEPRVLDELLQHYRESLERTRQAYVERIGARRIFSLARSKREADLWGLSIQHGIVWCEAEMEWIDLARRTLAKPRRRAQRKASQ